MSTFRLYFPGWENEHNLRQPYKVPQIFVDRDFENNYLQERKIGWVEERVNLFCRIVIPILSLFTLFVPKSLIFGKDTKMVSGKRDMHIHMH